MAGGPAVDPPLELTATPTNETAALRARLADAEASLSQTRLDLTSARNTIARDVAAAAARDAGGAAGAPAGAGGGSSPAADGGSAAAALGGGSLAASDAELLARGAAGGAGGGAPPPGGAAALDGAPLGADTLGDYIDHDEGDGSSAAGDAWAPRPGGAGRGCGFRGRRQPLDESGAYDDGFDLAARFTPADYLQSFDIPRSVLRDDGLPMPFTPSDPVHTATFTVGSRDEIEARHWYCSLAWSEQIFNEALAARHGSGHTVELLIEHLDWLVGATRRVFALGVSRYDYLALRQSEPNLADAFAHADAVPRNSLRGDGARRFLSRVVRAEAHASAKIGAAERGYAYPQRANRVAAPAVPGRHRSPARGGRGGGGGLGGGRGGGGLGGRGGRGGGGGGRGRGGGRA